MFSNRNNFLKAGILLLSISFFSCETEVDLITRDGDVTVVYALLDPDQDVQLIKVNKSFIDENIPVEELAQNPENFNFKEGEIEITLQGFQNGVEKPNSFYPNARYTKGKYDKNQLSAAGMKGIFSTEDNVVYEIDTKDNPLNEDYNYVLTVTNKVTGEVLKAETEIVDRFLSSSLLTPGNTNLKFALGTSEYDDVRFEFLTPRDGSRFEVYLLIKYYTKNADNSGSILDSNTIEIRMGEVSAPDQASNASQLLIFEFDGERYFRTLHDEFIKDLDKRYLLAPMEIKFVVGGQDLNTYITVNEPSDGLIQERPEFTNVENGLGIVSSRREFSFKGYYLENNVTAGEVRNGEYTLAKGIIVCHAERNVPGKFTCPL